jgi:hypothetical protein
MPSLQEQIQTARDREALPDDGGLRQKLAIARATEKERKRAAETGLRAGIVAGTQPAAPAPQAAPSAAPIVAPVAAPAKSYALSYEPTAPLYDARGKASDVPLAEMPEGALAWDPWHEGLLRKEVAESIRGIYAGTKTLIGGEGKIGFWETVARKPKAELIPFVGSLYSAANLSNIKSAAERLTKPEQSYDKNQMARAQWQAGGFHANELSPNEAKSLDRATIETFLVQQAEIAERGVTVPGKIASGIMELIPYMIEFYLTAGLAGAAKTPVQAAVRTLAAKYAANLSPKAVSALAGLGGLAAGAAVRTAAQTPFRVAAQAIERQLPHGMTFTPEGELLIAEAGDSPAKAWFRAYGDVFIEMFSEESGAAIGAAGGKILGKIPGARDAFARVAGALAKLPGAPKAAAMATRAGYNGFLEEMGEERLGGLLRAVTNIPPPGQSAEERAGFFSRVGQALYPGWENLLVEAGVLAVPGAAQVAAGAVMGRPSMPAAPPAAEAVPTPAPSAPVAPTPGSRADLVAQVQAMREAGEPVTPESVAAKLAVGRDVAATPIGEVQPTPPAAAPAEAAPALAGAERAIPDLRDVGDWAEAMRGAETGQPFSAYAYRAERAGRRDPARGTWHGHSVVALDMASIVGEEAARPMPGGVAVPIRKDRIALSNPLVVTGRGDAMQWVVEQARLSGNERDAKAAQRIIERISEGKWQALGFILPGEEKVSPRQTMMFPVQERLLKKYAQQAGHDGVIFQKGEELVVYEAAPQAAPGDKPVAARPGPTPPVHAKLEAAPAPAEAAPVAPAVGAEAEIAKPTVGEGGEVAPPTKPGALPKAVEAEPTPVRETVAPTGTEQPAAAVKNAYTETQRAEQGMPGRVKPTPRTEEEVLAEAKVAVAADPEIALRLVDNPSLIQTDTDVAHLAAHLADLKTRYSTVADQLIAAAKSEDGAAHAEAQAAIDRLLPELERAYVAAEGSGRVMARAFRFRDVSLRRDYSLAEVSRDWSVAHDGQQPSERVLAKLKAQADRIAELEKALAETDADKRGAAMKGAHQKLLKTAKAKRGAVIESRQKILDRAERRVAGGGGAESLGKVANDLAKQFISEGITEREALIDAVHRELQSVLPGITRDETMDAISGYGQFRPLSRGEIEVRLRDLKGQMQQLGKLRDMIAGQAPSKTGIERRTPSDEERRLIQQVNEAKRKGGFVVTDPATQLKSALDGIKTRLRNQIADLEEQLESRQQIVKKKTGVTYDAEALALKKQRDVLKAEYDEMFGTKELTDEQRIKMATASLERSVAEYERRVASGKYSDLFPGKKPSRTPDAAVLTALRARRDALRAELKELQDITSPQRTPEERAEKAYIKRTTTRIADLTDRLARGDYEKAPAKPPRILSPAEQKLQTELDRLKRKMDRARMSTPEKIWYYFLEASGINRALQAGGDISNAGRQLWTTGWNDIGNLVTGRPTTKWPRGVAAGTHAFVDAEFAAELDAELREEPSFRFLDKWRLRSESGPSTPIRAREESYPARLVGKIPLLRQGERAARTMTNYTAHLIYMELAPQLEARGLLQTQAQERQLAKFIGDMLGRGVLPKARIVQELTDVSNALVYSTRFAWSRIHNVTTLFGTLNANPVLRAAGLRNLAGGVVLTAILLALTRALGGDTDLDPTSPDFLKARFGNTRFDILGGHGVVIRFMARMGLSAYLQTFGDAQAKAEDRGAIIEMFVKSKVAPLISLIGKLATGKDFFGHKIEGIGGWSEEARQQFLFMWLNDGIDAFRDEYTKNGLSKALLKGALVTGVSWAGIGVQTYKDKPKGRGPVAPTRPVPPAPPAKP